MKRGPISCLFSTKSLLLRDGNENKGQRVRGEEKKLYKKLILPLVFYSFSYAFSDLIFDVIQYLLYFFS